MADSKRKEKDAKVGCWRQKVYQTSWVAAQRAAWKQVSNLEAVFWKKKLDTKWTLSFLLWNELDSAAKKKQKSYLFCSFFIFNRQSKNSKKEKQTEFLKQEKM